MEAELAQLASQPNPPPSNLSSPSGVPLSTIALLTHDELRQNAEFMKYVNMVTMLQELLKFRQGSTLLCKFFFFFFNSFPCNDVSTFLASTVADSPNSSLYPRPSSSLRLSDSVSHILSGLNRPPLPLPQPQPITGPSFYSPKLHWLWQEAREAICTKDNKSHLSMLQAIQDEDGIFILKDWWDSIRSTAVIVT